jgi:hypothetical protein
MVNRGEGVYVATCLDLSLGAQADTIEEAVKKLTAQIDELYQDAKENPEHARALLNRPAPFSMWLEYWVASVIARFMHRKNPTEKVFSLREDCLV